MNWLNHTIANILVGLFLFHNNLLISSLNLFIFFIFLSVIIDIDHYFLFSIKYRKKSTEEIIRIWKKHYKQRKPEFYIFHSPEFNIILLILSFLHPLILLIFISNLIHITLDAIDHRYFPKEWSIIHNLKKY